MSSAASSSLDGDDSDEEFLANAREGNDVDREALVRQKLLENFYGKDAAAAVAMDRRSSRLGSMDSSDNDEDEGHNLIPSSMDDPGFDPRSYVTEQISKSSLSSLLEERQSLSLATRTLESTTQTLVYENYSRFIDATDAIKSIGVHVQAHSQSLQDLPPTTERWATQWQTLEERLKHVRDRVAEQVRVQRLLTRLDALLRLPETLRTLVSKGSFQEATRDYQAAVAILGQHTTEFESLRRIEQECHEILVELRRQLTTKLLCWSGHVDRLSATIDATSVPNPPQSVLEIQECVGALVLLEDSERPVDDETPEQPEEDNLSLSRDELASMSLTAAARLLDRILDSHSLDIEEQRYEEKDGTIVESMIPNDMAVAAMELMNTPLIPRHAIEVILEVVPMFCSWCDTDSIHEFVSQALDSFLRHVHVVLSDEGLGLPAALTDLESLTVEASDRLTEAGFAAQGNSLQRRGGRIMDQLIRQGVDREFRQVQVDVARECLATLAPKVIEASSKESSNLSLLLQSTINDCLQLVDDTIRNVVVTEDGSSSFRRAAVEKCVRRLVDWLANALQLLVGGGVGPDTDILEAPLIVEEDEEQHPAEVSTSPPADPKITESDDVSELGEPFGTVGGSATRRALVDAMESLVDQALEDNTELMLALVQVFRSHGEAINQELETSIATHFGGKKKAHGLFPASGNNLPSSAVGESLDHASRQILVLYAMHQGNKAASLLLADLENLPDETPTSPRTAVVQALEILKTCAIECSTLLGGNARAGPVPSVTEPVTDYALPTQKTGLLLDVERMFMDKITTIIPHPRVAVEATRDAVLYVCFKVALRGWLEGVRLGNFSREVWQQIELDAELVTTLLPHYLDDSLVVEGINACSGLANLLREIVTTGSERCLEEGCLTDDSWRIESRELLRSFIESQDDHTFVIPE